MVAEQFHVNLGTGENRALLKRAFGAKRVPLQLLGRIKDHREFHRAGFPAVEDTLKPGENLRGFDFYFDYVVRLVGCLARIFHECCAAVRHGVRWAERVAAEAEIPAWARTTPFPP